MPINAPVVKVAIIQFPKINKTFIVPEFLKVLTLTKMRTGVSPILYLPSATLIMGNWVGHWQSDNSSRTWKENRKELSIVRALHSTEVAFVILPQQSRV